MKTKMDETLKRIRELVAQPPPRIVPKDIFKYSRNPIAVRLILYSLIGVVIHISMIVFTNQTVNWKFISIPYFALACGIIWAILSLRKVKLILAWGELYEGEVIRLRSLPIRKRLEDSRAFFLVTVKFNDRYGTERNARDVIDNYSFQYFLDARNEGEKVELIFTPRAARNVILPMKTAARVF